MQIFTLSNSARVGREEKNDRIQAEKLLKYLDVEQNSREREKKLLSPDFFFTPFFRSGVIFLLKR